MAQIQAPDLLNLPKMAQIQAPDLLNRPRMAQIQAPDLLNGPRMARIQAHTLKCRLRIHEKGLKKPKLAIKSEAG